jgi:CRP-like cAMP-binding protein
MEILRDPALVEGTDWRRRAVLPNEIVVREGELARKMYLVESGTLRVSGRVELEDRRRIQPGLCELGAGDLFGELNLFEQRPRTASVIALSGGCLLEVDCAALTRYLDTHPTQGYLFLKATVAVLIDRLTRADQRVEQLFGWGLKAHGIDRHL